MRARREGGHDVIEHCRQQSIHDMLEQGGRQFQVKRNADSATTPRHVRNQPGETVISEQWIRRSHFDSVWTAQCSPRRELQAYGPEAHDLLDMANIALAVSNAR
jgi:hypothetical protein